MKISNNVEMLEAVMSIGNRQKMTLQTASTIKKISKYLGIELEKTVNILGWSYTASVKYFESNS